MTNHNFSDLDNRIDSVARRMTDADPPADLRERVLAQLDERARSPWMWKVIPATAALLAVVLIAVALGRRSQSPLPSATLQTTAALTPGPSRAPDPQVADRPNVAVGEAPVLAAARQVVTHTITSRISDVEAEWQARALPALSQPAALTMGGIQPVVLAIRPLETRPVVIAPIGEDEDRF